MWSALFTKTSIGSSIYKKPVWSLLSIQDLYRYIEIYKCRRRLWEPISIEDLYGVFFLQKSGIEPSIYVQKKSLASSPYRIPECEILSIDDLYLEFYLQNTCRGFLFCKIPVCGLLTKKDLYLKFFSKKLESSITLSHLCLGYLSCSIIIVKVRKLFVLSAIKRRGNIKFAIRFVTTTNFLLRSHNYALV